MHNLSMLAFPSAPPTHVAPATRPQRATESHPSSSDRKNQLTDFLQNSPNPRACFRCMTSFTSPSYNFLSGNFILTSVNDTLTPALKFAPN